MSNYLRTVVYSVCTGEKGCDISALLLAFQNFGCSALSHTTGKGKAHWPADDGSPRGKTLL